MAVKIQIRRGSRAGLPTLSTGEYGLATDTGELFIGGSGGNLQVGIRFAPVRVTIPASGWTGSGPWTQTVAVAGVQATDQALDVCPVDVADEAARRAYIKAYNCLAAEAQSAAGAIQFTCRDRCPEIDFQVLIKGVR